MTRLKEIGCFSIDSEKSMTMNGGHWSGFLFMLLGFLLFVISATLIFKSPDITPLYFLILIPIGVIITWITSKEVPALIIILNDNSKKYSSIESRRIEVTKDIDKMTDRVQNTIDTFTRIANEKIAEDNEQKRINSCINDIEQKIITRIK